MLLCCYIVICCYIFLYVFICCYIYYMLLHVVICLYMLLYAVICLYMLLHEVICRYMLLYVAICCYMLLLSSPLINSADHVFTFSSIFYIFCLFNRELWLGLCVSQFKFVLCVVLLLQTVHFNIDTDNAAAVRAVTKQIRTAIGLAANKQKGFALITATVRG